MTRVVLDTNVFVSSFFGGVPRKIIDLWKTGSITLCLSASILEEYVRVLKELGLAAKPELGELLAMLSRGTNLVFTIDTPSLKIVKSDPDDDQLIECAVALSAQYIVSGDRDLLKVRQYMDIRILSPCQFLDLIRPAKP